MTDKYAELGFRNDPNLFDAVAHARHTDPIESHEAAATVDVTKSQGLVLRACRIAPRSTAAQLRTVIQRHGKNISDSGCRTRCKELCEAGLMKQVGHHMKHSIYVLTAEGQERVLEIVKDYQERKAA